MKVAPPAESTLRISEVTRRSHDLRCRSRLQRRLLFASLYYFLECADSDFMHDDNSSRGCGCAPTVAGFVPRLRPPLGPSPALATRHHRRSGRGADEMTPLPLPPRRSLADAGVGGDRGSCEAARRVRSGRLMVACCGLCVCVCVCARAGSSRAAASRARRAECERSYRALCVVQESELV